MTTWRPDFSPEHLYFVTTKAVKYAHLFQRGVMKRLIVDNLDCFRAQKRIKLYTFVIMPNHIHIIIQCRPDDPLADVLRDFKKRTSDRIVRHYQAEGNQEVLDFLASAVTRPEKQTHKVWEEGYHAEDVFSPRFLRQKIIYSHNNPCQPRRALVEQPEDYLWSSAPFYLLGHPAIMPLDNANELLA